MTYSRRAALPLIIAIVGIVILIGCIPIPATRQFQPDWKPRPENAIGRGSDKPIRIGYTKIDDAFIELNRRVTFFAFTPAPLFGEGEPMPITSPWYINNWRVSPDKREFSLRFSVRTVTWLMPLCFSVHQETAERWLTLEVDRNGIVTATRTLDRPPYWWNEPVRWLAVFDEPTRRKLQSENVLPSDDALELNFQQLQKNRQRFNSTQPFIR